MMLFFNLFVVAMYLLFVDVASARYQHPCHRRSRSSSPTPTTTSTTLAAATTSVGSTDFAGITASQILQAAPSTASCDDTPSCRTAAQAVPFINEGFEKYGFYTVGEQAALFSLMAFESGNFKYDVNVFPGRPGQGTRAMLMFPFVLEYALEINSEAVQAIQADISVSSAESVPDEQKNQIRATVLDDSHSFSAAAWFLRTKCPPSIAEGLQGATVDAFDAYMTQCIYTDASPERLALYSATLTAMGHSLVSL